MPARGAGDVEGGPAGTRVVACGEGRVPLEFGADAVGVAEDDGGCEAVAGERGCLFEHLGGSSGVAADARLDELVRLLGEAERWRVDLVLQSGPAREPVLAGESELGRCERELVGYGRDACDRGGVSGLCGAEELLRLAAELVEVRVGGE